MFLLDLMGIGSSESVAILDTVRSLHMSKPRAPITPTYPWLKQETTMLQHSKQTTGVQTWFQTWGNSCSSSNRPVSVSRATQSTPALLCQTQLAMLRCCTKRTARTPTAHGTMFLESSIEGPKGVRHVTVGVNGAHVVILL